MNSRFLLCILLTPPSLLHAAAPHTVPLGFEKRFEKRFEKQGDSFIAQASGAAISVDRAGFSVRSSAGDFRVRLRGVNPTASIAGQGSVGTRNWMLGRDTAAWRIGVPLFERVDVKNVYPGIDAAYYGRDAHLEYDFVVSPHARPADIELQIAGARSLHLDSAGNLLIDGPGGQFVQRRPTAYQIVAGARRSVQSRFLLAGTRVRFAVPRYDRSAPLIIDPVLAYSTYLGGTAADEGHAVAVDSSGNLFVAGRTYSTSAGNSHVLLLKVLTTGSTVQSIFGGTLGNDTANAVTVDSTGNVYLAGSTSSGDFPIAGTTVFQAELLGSMNAFVMAFNPTITLPIFSTYVGGSFSDEAFGIALGPNNTVYVVGDTESTNFTLITNNAFQTTNHGGYDAFLISLSSIGVANFGTYLGGSGDDHAYAVTVDSAGAIYVVGGTLSSDYPVSPGLPEPFQVSNLGNEDGFAIKFFATGQNAYWSTFIGGEGEDVANAVAVDSAGIVYVAGVTASLQFPVSTGAYQTVFQGGASDGFVTALESNGQYGAWSTYVGSDGADVINSIALDGSGNIVLTGSTDGLKFPTTADAVQAANAGGQDVILATLSHSGASLLYSTYFGGGGNDVATGVALDSSGRTYLTGITSSNNDLPVTSGALQTVYGGGASDAFVAIFGCPVAVPVIASGGIGNAASYLASAVSPGGVIAIFGSNFGCTPAAAPSIPLPLTLGGVTVKVNGTAIPLFYVGESQINAQLPYETAVGTATVTVTAPGGTSAAVSLPVIAAGPGIFVINSQAAAFNADGTLNTPTNPAAVGSYISVYFTGQGPVSQPIVTGAAPVTAPPYSNVTLANSATIGGMASTIYFMGLAPGLVGLAQANLLVPNLTSGNYPLVLTINGFSSAPATVSVTQ